MYQTYQEQPIFQQKKVEKGKLQRYNLWRFVIKLILGAAGNIACYGPVLAERADVVIELFVMYNRADYSYNGSFWYSEKFRNICFLKMFFILQ